MPLFPNQLSQLGLSAMKFTCGNWTQAHSVALTLMSGDVPPLAARAAAAAELRAYKLNAVLPQSVTEADEAQAAEIAKIIEGL